MKDEMIGIVIVVIVGKGLEKIKKLWTLFPSFPRLLSS